MHNFRTNQRIPDVNRGVFFQPAKPPSLSTHTVQVRKFKHYFAHLLPDILKKNEIDWPQETQQAVNITYRKVREGSDNPDQDIVYFDECTPKTKKLLYDIIEGNTDAVMAEFPLEESTSFDKLCEVYVHTEPGSRRRFTRRKVWKSAYVGSFLSDWTPLFLSK